MNSTRTRRALGAAAATAVAALSVGTLAVPAHAADHALKLNVSSTIQIPTEPAAQPQFGDNVSMRIGRTGSGDVTNAVLTLDTSGLDGVASLSVQGNACSTAAKVISCKIYLISYEDINITDYLWLSALPGVKAGSSGAVHATLSAPGAESAATDFRVEVGGAAFRTAEIAPLEKVKTGSTFSPGLRFANRGDVSASRTVIEVMLVPGLSVDHWPSNCEYATSPGQVGKKGFGAPIPTTHGICTIEGEILPNEPVRLNGLDLTVTSEALYTFADFTVYSGPDMAGTQGPALRKQLAFQRGTGAPATLTRDSAVGIPSGFPDRNAHFVEQEVYADNGADFELTGVWAPDPSGRKGALTVTATNRGPASIMDRSLGEGTPHIRVQLPEGASIAELPKGCQADDYVLGQKQDRSLNKFDCEVFDWFMPNGATASRTLGVQLDEGTTPLSATVSFQDEQSDLEEGYPAALMTWDPNQDNNRVKVALRSAPAPAPTTPAPAATPPAAAVVPAAVPVPVAAPVAATPGPTAPARAARSSSSTVTADLADGGELPDTGSEQAVPLAWASGTALALGTAAVLTSRRLGRRRA
ncbi:hypothetical protein [Kitasatospora sp. NPDC093806]|uniref:hypothetical protein n=1 Tax=Kitasatospora sp. NPDC093806 TaxID=3155075 RepID=UPI0034391E7B